MHMDAELAARLLRVKVAANVEYAKAQEGLLPGSTAVLPIAGGACFFFGPDSYSNRALGLGMDGPVTEADLDQVEAFFESRGVPVHVDLCPLAHPTLLELLGKRGYQLVAFRNQLVLPVAEVKLVSEPAPGVQVSVAGPEEEELWIRTVMSGFHEEEITESVESSWARPIFHRSDAICYLARIDGEPAGGGALTLTQGVGFLQTGSTRLGFRGRGVQTALIQARMAEAVRSGCDLVAVEATPGSGSQRNLERAGFRVAYTQVVLRKG
jgi:GNAT superfamily N-acetyltransferase